jgi:transcriptional regulator with XRE-family HTH domain
VPEVSFLTFRAACRRVLARAEFDQVDAPPMSERRVAAGWSVPELARRLGVQASIVWAIERGRLQALHQLPFSVLLDLAQVLDVDLAELFAMAGIPWREPHPDLAVIEAVLLRHRDGLTRETLAHGLGWSLERLDRAIEQLADSALISGGRLARGPGNCYRIEARRSLLTLDEWRGVAQAAASAGGGVGPLSVEAATLLYGLLYSGRPVASGTCGHDDHAVLELLRQELIEDIGDRFGAVAELAYSQGLVGADRLAPH